MEKDVIISLIDGVVTTQGIAIATRDILRELVFRWALSQPDPAATLRDMFSSITARMDAGSSDGEKRSYGEAREYIDLIFTGLDRRLQQVSK